MRRTVRPRPLFGPVKATASVMVAVAALLTCILTGGVRGEIENYEAVRDSRALYVVTSFGFESGGHFELDVRDFTIYIPQGALRKVPSEQLVRSVGFFLRKHTLGEEEEFDEDHLAYAVDVRCGEGGLVPSPGEQLLSMADSSRWSHRVFNVNVTHHGFYSLYFINCYADDLGLLVSFRAHIEQFNGSGSHRNYLSFGDEYLPFIYGCISFLWVTAAIVWIHFLFTHRRYIRDVHYLMTLIMVLKTGAVVLSTMRYQEIKKSGEARYTKPPFYFFEFSYSVCTVTVLCVIATGWSYLKPFLSTMDKRVLVVTLALRLFTASLAVMVHETHPAEGNYEALSSLESIFDFASLISVIVLMTTTRTFLTRDSVQTLPVHFRRVNIEKLRWFFRLFGAYIYVSRIFLHILRSLIPPFTDWLPLFLDELVELGLICGVLFVYRKPYLYESVESDDDDDDLLLEMDEELERAKMRSPHASVDGTELPFSTRHDASNGGDDTSVPSSSPSSSSLRKKGTSKRDGIGSAKSGRGAAAKGEHKKRRSNRHGHGRGRHGSGSHHHHHHHAHRDIDGMQLPKLSAEELAAISSRRAAAHQQGGMLQPTPTVVPSEEYTLSIVSGRSAASGGGASSPVFPAPAPAASDLIPTVPRGVGQPFDAEMLQRGQVVLDDILDVSKRKTV